MSDEPRRRLRAEAAGQDGQFATAQAHALGVTRSELTTMRRRGEVVTLRRGVSRLAGTPGDPDEAVSAALACWPHGIIAGASAAQHHGLTRVAPPEAPVVLIEHGIVLKQPGIDLRWSRRIPTADVLVVGGVRYTSLARTVVDLADPTDPWETFATVDDAVALGAKPGWLHACASALTFGRAGPGLVRDVTAPEAAGVFRSWLERTAGVLFRVSGLPEPQWNVAVHDERGRIGVVDALWPPWRVISEKEGLRFHTAPEQRRRDAERFNRLSDARYTARRFTWGDVVHRPGYVVETLARALRAAGAALPDVGVPEHLELPALPFPGGG